MDQAKIKYMAWDQYRLLHTVLYTNNNELIEGILKECKQELKNLNLELIIGKWDALSVIKQKVK